MKTIGLIPSKILASLEQDEVGNYIDVPDNQTVVPLVKINPPTITSAQKAEPHLAWFADRVERQWTIVDLSAEEIAAQYPSATKLQARVWLIRNGIDPANVPAIIEGNFPPGAERLEALERWNSAATIPFNHPLVAVIAASLNLDPAAIWSQVLAIE